MKNNIKHIYRIWIAVGLLGLCAIYYFIPNASHRNKNISQVCTGEQCFTVEVARTSAEHQQGLMYRTGMVEDKGMLFIFPESKIHSFWMKNTLIPLDMIRIDDTYRVVHIANAQPCTEDPCMIYSPEKTARYVIEVNAGIAAKWGIQEGTRLKFRNIE